MAGLLDPNRPALLQMGAGKEMTAKQIAQEYAKEKAREEISKATTKAALTSAKAAPQTSSLGAAKGLLGRIGGAAFGPIGAGIQAAVMPGELGNGELSREQNEALIDIPQDESDKYKAWAEGVAGRAAQAGIDYRNQMTPEVQQEAPAPVVDPMVAAEPIRQQAKVGLDVAQARGDLPVKQIATALVDKQIEASGEKSTPEDRQKRISQERKLISDLPAEEKSDYLSWALVAAGLIAGATDESGAAGRAFGAGFESELNRKHQKKLKQEEREMRKEEREEDRDMQREVMENQNESLDKRFAQQDKTLEKTQAQQMLLFDKGQELQRAQMAQQERYQSAMLGLQQNRIDAALAKANGQAAPKLDINQDDAEEITKGVASQLGVPLSKEVNQSLAAQLRAAAKTDPNFDPQRFVGTWLKMNQDKLQSSDPWGPGDNITTFKPITQ